MFVLRHQPMALILSKSYPAWRRRSEHWVPYQKKSSWEIPQKMLAQLNMIINNGINICVLWSLINIYIFFGCIFRITVIAPISDDTPFCSDSADRSPAPGKIGKPSTPTGFAGWGERWNARSTFQMSSLECQNLQCTTFLHALYKVIQFDDSRYEQDAAAELQYEYHESDDILVPPNQIIVDVTAAAMRCPGCPGCQDRSATALAATSQSLAPAKPIQTGTSLVSQWFPSQIPGRILRETMRNSAWGQV